MSKWPMVPLGEILTKSTEQVEILPHETYREVTVRLWGKGVDLRREATGAEIKADKRFTVTPGQFIVSRIDARNGAFGLIPEDLNGAIVSNDFPVFDANHKRLDPAFLNWLSKTSAFVDLCRRASEGTTNRVRLKENLFLQMEIPLPPLSEQQKIVEWIDPVATRVEEAKALQAQSDQLVQRVLQSSVSTIFEEHLESDKNWKLIPLTKVATVARGKFGFRPRNDPRFYGGKFPFIQIGDISDANRYIRQFSQTLNEQGLEVSRMFPKGTVVIAITGATIGATGILTFDSCFPDSIVGINPLSDEVPTEYLFWALEYAKSHALAQATQTTQPNINLRILNTLQIPISSTDNMKNVAQSFNRLFDSLNDQLKLYTERAEEIKVLVPSILNQVFSGGGNG